MRSIVQATATRTTRVPSTGSSSGWTVATATLLLFLAVGCAPAGGTEPVPTEPSAAPGSTETSAEVPSIVLRALDHHGSNILERSNVELTVTSKSGSFGVIAQPGPVFDYTIFSGTAEEPVITRHTNKPGEPELTLTRGDEPVEISDPQTTRDFVSARVYFLFLPYRLLDPSTVLTDLGMEQWNGRDLHKVKLTFASGTSTNADEGFLLWFDPDSAQLEQFAYSFSGGVRFRKMVNWRRIEGLLVADHENYAHNKTVPVDVVTPEFAADMDLLSTVELTGVSLTPR